VTRQHADFLDDPSAKLRFLVLAAALFVLLKTFWIYIVDADSAARRAAADRDFAEAATGAADSFRERIDGRLRGLAHIGNLARAGALDNAESFEIAAASVHETAREFLAINLVDADRRIVRVWPAEANAGVLGRVVGQSPAVISILESARDTDTPRATGIVDLFQGGKGIATYYPIRRDGNFVGYVNGVFRLDAIVGWTGKPVDARYTARVQTEGAIGPPPAGTHRHAIPILDRTIEFDIVDTGDEPTPQPIIAKLALGVALSAGCAGLLYFWLITRDSGASREAMLSSILLAAPDAIVAADVDGIVRVFTPAAEKMFGLPARAAIGEPLDRLLPAGARAGHREHLAAFAASGAHTRLMGDWRTIRGLRASGEEFPVMVTLGKSEFAGRSLMTAILRDMTEIGRIHEDLVTLADQRMREAERAQAANQAKTMFLATMSHELRTPLNAIIGFSDIAAREMFGPIGNARYKDYLVNIRQSGENLLAIINDVLDLSNVEVGAYRFEPVDFDLGELLDATGKQLAPLTETKGLVFRTDLPRGTIAHGDLRATRQIAVNLLSNAIKFTEPGGEISLSAGPAAAGFVAFEVRDTGRGISPEDIDRVGRPFVQVGDAYRSEVKGTGLGLAISSAFAKGMGGSVDIKSTLGTGTRVTVTLPASPAGLKTNI
jgi:PAS domain S-box-containing protein